MNKLIEQLAELAKVEDKEAFASAIQSETDTDYELNLDGLVVRTKEEDNELRENIANDKKSKWFNDAFEIQIKNLKKDYDLDFEGKDAKDFVEAFKEKILKDSNVEPNKKIQEMESSLKRLQDQVQEKEQAYADLQNNVNTEKTRYKVQSLIPDLPETLGLNKEEAATLLFSQMEFKEDGVYRNGELLKDNLEKPVSYEDAVKGFVTDRGWNVQQPSGRGGGAKGKGGNSFTISSQDEFEQHIKEKGLHPGSREAQAILSKAIEENPDFE